VLVVWCPIGDMIGDYATKPIQGALFRIFRDHIMGVVPAQDPGPGKTDGGVGKTEINGTIGVCWEWVRRTDIKDPRYF
jgi:hypothetical protein